MQIVQFAALGVIFCCGLGTTKGELFCSPSVRNFFAILPDIWSIGSSKNTFPRSVLPTEWKNARSMVGMTLPAIPTVQSQKSLGFSMPKRERYRAAFSKRGQLPRRKLQPAWMGAGWSSDRSRDRRIERSNLNRPCMVDAKPCGTKIRSRNSRTQDTKGRSRQSRYRN